VSLPLVAGVSLTRTQTSSARCMGTPKLRGSAEMVGISTTCTRSIPMARPMWKPGQELLKFHHVWTSITRKQWRQRGAWGLRKRHATAETLSLTGPENDPRSFPISPQDANHSVHSQAVDPGTNGVRGAFGRWIHTVKDLVIHDDDDDMDIVGSQSDGEAVKKARRVIWFGIVGDIFLTIVKAGMGTLAKSPALIADSLHSLSDIIGHMVTLVCVQIARRPNNEAFPYGFGKFETAGSLGVAFLMIMAGFELIRESISIINSPPAMFVDPILQMAAAFTAFAAVVIKELLYRLTASEGRRQGSPMLSTAAWHHRSDAMSSAVALIGIGGSIMGVRWADPLAGSVVAALVLAIGLQIAWKSARELLDVAVPPETLERLQALVQEASDSGFKSLDADQNNQISLEEWVRVYGSEDGFSAYDRDGNGYIDIREWNANVITVKSVRARKMGPHLMLDVDISVPSGARFKEIQIAQDRMLKHIHESNPRVREIRFQLSTDNSP